MEISQINDEIEGWLYLIRQNRLGLEYLRKRYFVLEQNCLKCFKSIPNSGNQEPVRSAIIDSCIRICDNGRESYHGKIFFIFTLYNTSNHNDQIKLGARSPEEAARWIECLNDVAVKPESYGGASSKRKWQPFRLNVSKKTSAKSFANWTSAVTIRVDAMTSDVIAPSPWKIFGCQNGLRLFKEAKYKDSSGRHWDDNPAIMAVGVVDGTSEAIFRTLMSLGSARSEWDFCFHRGTLVEHLDGHTDIIHMQFYKDFLPWGMRKRDFLLRRYWRREDDGTYVILYHSVIHRKCPPQPGYVRAFLKSGGYVVMPVDKGKKSVVKQMHAIDWKFWKPYLRKTSARSLTIQMLMRVAALREMFKANTYTSCEFLPHNIDKEKIVREEQSQESSLFGFSDPSDEFFDVPESSSDDGQSDQEWPSDQNSEYQPLDSHQSKTSSTATFVKRLHDLAVPKKVHVDSQDPDHSPWNYYGSTLPKDLSCKQPCTWSNADPSSFLIRGESYLKDRHKVKAKGTLMQMVAADWLKSDKREDDVSSRPGGIVQRYATQGGQEFFFIVNMQVPGTPNYSLVLYYMMDSKLEESPLLDRFVNGDDAYRNSRFKLIPYISKGSWIVKQSVGKKAGLVGQALQVNYFRGNNYLELCIDVGSSTVARGVVSLVLGYLNNLVIEMAFLIQADTEEELPEFLLGTCRLNHMDIGKSVWAESMSRV